MTHSRTGATLKDMSIAIAAMVFVVVLSNILVQYPFRLGFLEEFLTWGAFPYPFAFLVSDLTNRRFGPRRARHVAYAGFAVAVVLSIYLATPRIAIASGTAFLAAQLLDISIFTRMNQKVWWLPPFISSTISAGLDTLIFFSVAFYCGPLPLIGHDISSLLGLSGVVDHCEVLPWTTLAFGDYCVKLCISILSLAPYGVLLAWLIPGALTVRKA